ALVRGPGSPPACRGDLGRTHGLSGLALYHQKEFADARREFEAAVGDLRQSLRANPNNPDYQRPLRDNYPNLAETLLRLGELAPAADAAVALARVFPGEPRDAYHAACFLARCAAAAKDPGQRGRYTSLALEHLRRALDNGFADLEQFQKDRASKFR